MRSGLFILLSFVFSYPVMADPTDPVASSAPAPAAQCDLVMAGLSKFDPRLADVFKFVSTIDPDVLSLSKIPRWQDIEDFKAAIQKIKDAKADLKASGQLDELMQWSDKALAGYPLDPTAVKISDAVKLAKQNDVYKPTEYDLKRIYENLIYQYDKEVPAYLRIPLKHLPYDTRKITLIPKAIAIVKRQGQLFEKYIPTTGFSDMQSYEDAVSKTGPVAQKLLNMLKHGKFELAMNRPEGARWWVPKVGFQNTDTIGTKGAGYVLGRDQKEAGDTFQKFSEYKDDDLELKPEYGYLRPSPDAGFKQSHSADGYGTDTYVFKPEAMKQRVTWTKGNSSDYLVGDAENPQPKDWESFMVPLSHRTLGIPGMLLKAEKENTAYEFADFAGSYSSDPSIVAPPYPAQPLAPLETRPVQPPLPKNPPQPPMTGMPVVPKMPDPVPQAPPAPQAPTLTGNAATDLKAQQDYQTAMSNYYGSTTFKNYQSTYSTYMQAYQSSAEYQAYLKANNDFYAAYYKSPDYQNWMALIEKNQRDYYNSQVYVDFTKAVSDWQQAWFKSPVYQKYLADVNAYQSSPAYLDYLDKLKKSKQAKIDAFYGKSPLKKFKGSPAYGYFELQYWGPVDLDDVTVFEFHRNPPSGEFLNELKSRNIIIRDGRVEPAVVWNGSSK